MPKSITVHGGGLSIDEAPPTIQQVVGGTQAAPAQLNRDDALTVVYVVENEPNANWVQLPTGCTIADVFEVHGKAGASILPPPNESFISGGEFATGVVRKLTATLWGQMTLGE